MLNMKCRTKNIITTKNSGQKITLKKKFIIVDITEEVTTEETDQNVLNSIEEEAHFEAKGHTMHEVQHLTIIAIKILLK